MAAPFVFFDVRTTDATASRKFFAELLGWQVNDKLLVTEQGPWGGLTELGPDDSRQPQWLPYAPVADVDAAAAKAVELGGTIVRPRTELPSVGSLVVVTDPGGAALTLFQPAS